MEDVLRAIVLGIVQGLTEFLPVSSSGHLIVVRELFGWEFADDLTFDVALHIGTTVALVAFFWSEWMRMLRSAYRWARNGGRDPEPDPLYNARLLALLAVASVPAGVAGLLFNGFIEEHVRSPLIVGAMLLAFGVVLLAAERLASLRRDVRDVGLADAIIIGGAQAISLVPGVSRSGVTISAALARGLNRQDAARYSFLLSTPVIAAAGALKVVQAVDEGVASDELAPIAVGAVVAAVVGWLAIRYLLRLVRTGSFVPFVLYRFAAGLFVLAYFLA